MNLGWKNKRVEMLKVWSQVNVFCFLFCRWRRKNKFFNFIPGRKSTRKLPSRISAMCSILVGFRVRISFTEDGMGRLLLTRSLNYLYWRSMTSASTFAVYSKKADNGGGRTAGVWGSLQQQEKTKKVMLVFCLPVSYKVNEKLFYCVVVAQRDFE